MFNLGLHTAFFRSTFLLCVAFATFTFSADSPAQVVGEKAKLNNIKLFDGSQFDPDSVKGKVVLLYFWASWCPTCYKEMPVVEKYYMEYKDQGFTVLAINFRDKIENAKKMLGEVAPIDFPVGKINDDYRSDYPKLHGTPTWYLIDRSGAGAKTKCNILS